MLSDMNDKFSVWLLNEIQSRGWSQAELARRAGSSRTAISDVISEKHPAGFDLCIGIAQALKYPPEAVLRAAGLLPQVSQNTEALEKITFLFTELTPSERVMLIEYAQFLLSKKDNENK
jgi:transcriptional regulator with XRE-family HTH domain